jgi:hypothetical protein
MNCKCGHDIEWHRFKETDLPSVCLHDSDDGVEGTYCKCDQFESE